MQPRVSYEDFVKAAPGAYSGLGALSKSVDESGLDKSLTEFVKLRASQINGCAFCVSFHLNMLRKLGAPREKIDLITVWREAGIFPVVSEAALRATLGILARTVARGYPGRQA